MSQFTAASSPQLHFVSSPGVSLHSSPVSTSPATTMSDYYGGGGGGKSAATSDTQKIFVGALSWQTTPESMRYHFEQYGQVLSVEIMKDRHTGDPRGFGFVVFADSATVDLVMKDRVHEINHKVVDVKRAQARGVAPPSIHGDAPQEAPASSDVSPEQMKSKVFVGGLPPHIDKDGLTHIFSQFGPVTDAVVMLDTQTQRSRGFGFVTFSTSDGAQKAIAAQPVSVDGRSVEVKLATPRGEQQRRPPPAVKRPFVSTGPYAGLANSYGRSGWKAGYGSFAFGASGWAVPRWESPGQPLERSGFSFSMVPVKRENEGPPSKKSRLQ